MTDQDHEDPEATLANTFDDPTHNPFQPEQQQDDDEERSVASQQLRDNFIRMTTSTQEVPDPVGAPHDYDYSNYNENGYVMISNSNNNAPQSLAKAATTPSQLSVLLPVACIVTHALFLYGQIAPMWNLSLTAEDIDVWATSTSITSDLLFKALELDHNTTYQLQHNHTVQEFTYGFAVQELWEAKGMSQAYLAKTAAIGLILFSGIWPHLKLILLQYCWVTPTNNVNRRTSTLGWLALLGKWSLADVLTVCVMVGVLNLEWVLDPDAIKTGVANHLHTLIDLASQIWSVSDICQMALNFDASDCNKVGPTNMVSCRLCKDFVKTAYNNPETVETTGKRIVKDILMGGRGAVRLSVKGMEGIYFFCAAVILSVLLSAVVEWYNHLQLETLRKERASSTEENTLSLTEEGAPFTNSSATSPDLDSAPSEQPLLLEDAPPRFEPMEMEIRADDHSVFSGVVHRTTSHPMFQWFQCNYILPTITLVFVVLAVYLPSMERHVGGGIPDLLKDVLGIQFGKTYSLETLSDTTGAAGGWDYLLMATFGLFCVVGPLLRAILVVGVAMTKPTPDTRRIRSLLVRMGNFLAAFCAWEVFLVAMVMVELIMPTATDTILNTDACHIIAKDGASCLHVSYERVHTTFACLILGWLLIGGLSIHVSLQDKKERESDGDGGEASMQSNFPVGPPIEIDTTPSYSMMAQSDTLSEADSTINSQANVRTMIEQEMV